MPVLRSTLDVRSADFAENSEYHRSLVAELDERLARVSLGGGEKARDKLTLEMRIAQAGLRWDKRRFLIVSAATGLAAWRASACSPSMLSSAPRSASAPACQGGPRRRAATSARNSVARLK